MRNHDLLIVYSCLGNTWQGAKVHEKLISQKYIDKKGFLLYTFET
ncbi:MAG: hypothetical protein RLZZ517_118 [Candidatus Parcubacteria bacterium]|jgi:hypothetical protein